MNTVEIEAALSDLALQKMNAADFPFAFLSAFGHKDTALKRLRTGNSNKSDLTGGVLQGNNIHIDVCAVGAVGATLKASRPHRFVEIRLPSRTIEVVVPRVSSEDRPYPPVGFLPERSIITEVFGFYDAVPLEHGRPETACAENILLAKAKPAAKTTRGKKA
jgi:hypothetical protein